MTATQEGPRQQLSLYDRHPGLREAIAKTYPDTVLLIPDGNGRWAKAQSVSISEGHARGADVLVKFLPAFVELPTKTFIPWSFSYDNWSRPEDERDGIMAVINLGLQNNVAFFEEHDIRFIRMGREDRIQHHYPELWNTLCTVEDLTRRHENKLLALPLDFSGTDQVVRMHQRFYEQIRQGTLPPDFQVTPEFIETLRDGGGLVKPADLIIRTSGEQRTSDLSWLNTNSEFYVIPKLLPDCEEADFVAAFIDYPNRQRRFGARPQQSV